MLSFEWKTILLQKSKFSFGVNKNVVFNFPLSFGSDSAKKLKWCGICRIKLNRTHFLPLLKSVFIAVNKSLFGIKISLGKQAIITFKVQYK